MPNILAIIAAVSVIFGVDAVLAQTTPKSLEQELLDDESATRKADRAKSQANKEAEEAALKSTDHASDPLSKIVGQMREAQDLVGQRRSDVATQRLQQQIADQLAAMIDDAAQRSKSSGSKTGTANVKSPDPNESEKKSDGPAGTNGAGDPKPGGKTGPQSTTGPRIATEPAAVWSALRGKWGHLPQRPPEIAGQSARIRYLPKYEQEIEQYFLRLMEEE